MSWIAWRRGGNDEVNEMRERVKLRLSNAEGWSTGMAES